jgi:hypothetical protein
MKLFTIAPALCLGLLLSGLAYAGPCANESPALDRAQVESMLDDVAMIHSIDPALLAAIARVESGECSDAVSPKGAVGLMQLMPATARQFGVANRFDPIQNALGAARFIDYLKRDRPQGTLTLAEIVAAYNAGEGAVTRAGGIPRYRETEEYVRRVLWLYLIGHVPESEHVHSVALDAPRHSKPKAPASQAAKPSHRFAAGSDSEILAQLAEVRRARRQSEQHSQSTTGALAQ